MSWNKKIQHPSKVVKVGEEVDVVVLDIKPSDRRVSLGIKQAQEDPWLLIAEKYPVGTVVTGKVRNIAEFGAFVEIEEGFDGLVHVGDVSWTGRVKNPHEVFKKGEDVTAKVLKIDPENRRVSLGIKQVNDIWGDWFKQHKVGQIVKGKVSRIATFGAFVELVENIEALCHNTEIEDRRRRDEGMGGYRPTTDRKSTRLNSSHGYISYAVFCLKKKNNRTYHHPYTPYILPPSLAYSHSQSRPTTHNPLDARTWPTSLTNLS